MFETILLTTDGDPNGNEAVETAVELARHHRSHVVVLHVSHSAVTPEPVRAQVEQLRRVGIPARLAVVGDGDQAASAITDYAAALNADVVITATGNGGMAGGSSLVGHVAQRILALSPCPVLAVPADCEA